MCSREGVKVLLRRKRPAKYVSGDAEKASPDGF